ncbi:UNC93-like protein C922.05c-like protein [Martensiomyces pterosporus]|nr:UNC93-like protein C922.05c-like protein [Martensiomyces pterosporus]
MFNALNGTGGGGQLDATTNNNANTALYSTFVVFGVLGGAIVNLFGVRWTIFGSGFTYALYSGSYIYLNHTGKGSFTIAAGALLGVGAGILWAAQGMILVSYPREEEKAKYIAVFWVIFNMGGVLGGLIPFAMNYNTTEAKSLSDGVYIAFVILECLGAFLGLALAPPSKVTRNDGSSVVLVKYTNVGKESIEIVKLFLNPLMLALLPMCFNSNFFTTYQFDSINGALFNTRTRGFNNIMYWLAQMIGAYLISLVLDNKHLNRKQRGFVGFAIILVACSTRMIGAYLISLVLDSKHLTRKQRGFAGFVIILVAFNGIWGGSLAVQNKYPGGIKDKTQLIDFKESSGRAGGPIALYFFCGMGDAFYQSFAYWIIGALTNNNQILARYAGFYKGMQSFGAAIAWQLDVKTKPKNQLIGNWVLFAVSLLPMFYVILTLKDHSEDVVPENEKEYDVDENAAEHAVDVKA